MDYDSTDSDDTARNHAAPNSASTSATEPLPSPHSGSTIFLLPQPRPSGEASLSSTASSTPFHSRASSPLPRYHNQHGHFQSSSCPSDTDDELHSPISMFRSGSSSGDSSRYPWWRENRRSSSWWSTSPRRRRKRNGKVVRTMKKWWRRIARLPFCPSTPITMVLILILLSIFAISLTLLLMYILNPDKEPLPWRAYCSVPSLVQPSDPSPYPAPQIYPQLAPGEPVPAFPPPNFESLPPAGLFVGVFSVDSAFERRMLVRTTWASHPRSREGAVGTDEGRGTSRTVVRFVLGQPRKDWERRVKLEMETYNDIVILPIPENMNSGKTHSFFSWASLNAWVPPLYTPSDVPLPQFSYSNYTASPPSLAPHDPSAAWENIRSEHPRAWVRPDYVAKVDDDSFVMLAELEARLRLELHNNPDEPRVPPHLNVTTSSSSAPTNSASSSSSSGTHKLTPTAKPHLPTFPETLTDNDPLIYWGYLVKNRLHEFMAGELYALSWSLVDWVAKDATVKTMTRGAEDKQTSKWMRAHPRADKVRWTSERCWIYDHPRSGTVYAHGYLFPSEVTRIKRVMMAYLQGSSGSDAPEGSGSGSGKGDKVDKVESGNSTAAMWSYLTTPTPTPGAWSHSSVSTFGVRYAPPVPDLSTKHSVEALVEGSNMSMLREGNPMTPEHAWLHREGRLTRYENQRVGGTVVVHFIKKNMWYLETAMALLEGEDVSEVESYTMVHPGKFDVKAWAKWSHNNFHRQSRLLY